MFRASIALGFLFLIPLTFTMSMGEFVDATAKSSTGGFAKCISGSIPITFTAENVELLYDGPKNSMELTQLFQEFQWIGSNVVPRMIGGKSTMKGTYSIFARLCMPKDATPQSLGTVHVLTHGAALTHTYWDRARGFSYVDAAAKAGFATLSYDRLGVGQSAHPDPIKVVQASANVEVLHGLVQALRAGLEGYKFENVVGVGHSFGSWYTQETATRYPKDFNALVLTGTSSYFDNAPVVHSSMQAQIANTDPSGRFKDLPNGYITQADVLSAHQFNLYYHPHFEESVLRSQHEDRDTISIGEMLTLPTLMRPSTWTGPLDVVNGLNDFVYCAGNCLHDGDQTAKFVSVFFPEIGNEASTFNLPETGHSLPGHHRAQEAYDHIFDFLEKSNLSNSKAEVHNEL